MLHRPSKSGICKEFSYFSEGLLLFVILGISLSGYEVRASQEVFDDSGAVIEKDNNLSDLPDKIIQRSKPQIALVIDDLGENPERSKRAIALPSSVTLAFLPFSNDVLSLAQQATASGHDILIHMPMEPLDSSSNPGPNALRLSMTFRELLAQIRWAFSRIPGAVGLNNHMGSKFTQDENAMSTLIGELKVRDMIFLDSRTTPDTQGLIVAKKRNLRSISRDVFLDNDRSKKAIEDQLTLAEHISQKKGWAVVIGHPYPETLSVLEEWLATAESRGYLSVSITRVLSVPSDP